MLDQKPSPRRFSATASPVFTGSHGSPSKNTNAHGRRNSTSKPSHSASPVFFHGQPALVNGLEEMLSLTIPTAFPKPVRSRSICRIIKSSALRKGGFQPVGLDHAVDNQDGSPPLWSIGSCKGEPLGLAPKRGSVGSNVGCATLDNVNSTSAGKMKRSASVDENMLLQLRFPFWLHEHHDEDSPPARTETLALPIVRRRSRALSLPGSAHEINGNHFVSIGNNQQEEQVRLSPSRMLLDVEEGLRKASRIEKNGEISSTEEKNIKELLIKSCSMNDRDGVYKVLHSLVSADEDYLDLDFEDTHSESTSESSCTSPRQSLLSGGWSESGSCKRSVCDDLDSVSDYLPSDASDHDNEASALWERLNKLLSEFRAHRQYEENRLLVGSIQRASRMGVVPGFLEPKLIEMVNDGSYEEARDTLHRYCHLVPAVQSVVDNSNEVLAASQMAAGFLQYVDEVSPTETTEVRNQKLLVLRSLSDLVAKWVKLVGQERDLSEEHIALTSGALYLAGSYRLGLNDPSSDIDAVCVAPWHVTREDFFGSFVNLLRQTPGISQLTPVPAAYVPLISLSFHGVDMDLLFARLPMARVDSNQDIDSDHILAGVDPASMKSLNAPRGSSMILSLVPSRRVFRIVLRAVRAWARKRGIYSSKMGYLGGVSWAILVAFVCQLHPEAEPYQVFIRFFQVLSTWRWPQPIMLNVPYDAGMGFEMWDPRQNIYDRAHLMPIITPTYPHMNSAVQISQSTLSVIYEEIWRARFLLEDALTNTRAFSFDNVMDAVAKPKTADQVWNNVFLPSNFFVRYEQYVMVTYEAETIADMNVWGKFVQSRLRKLVDSLSLLKCVCRAHALPVFFPVADESGMVGSCLFIGLDSHPTTSRSVQKVFDDEDLVVQKDPEVVSNVDKTTRFFFATDLQQFGSRQQSMKARAVLLSWDELPEFVFPRGLEAARVEREQVQEEMELSQCHENHHDHGHGYGGMHNGMNVYGNGNRFNKPNYWKGKYKNTRKNFPSKR